MYRSRERIQDVALLFADMICFIASYFGGGYLWLVVFRNVSVANMKTELLDSFAIVLVIYMLVLLFSDIEKKFIDRNLYRDFWAGIEAGVAIVLITSVTIFLRHNNAEASRGAYFCIAAVNTALFFATHVVFKYYLLKVYRNNRATNQVFLVTTSDRVKDIIANIDHTKDWAHRLASIAIIDDNQVGKWYEGIPVVATYDNMFQYVKEQIVDEVFLNVPYDTGESLAKVANRFGDMGATVHVTIEILNKFDDYHKSFHMLGNIPVVTFSTQQYNWKMLILKRMMDIAGALAGLLITGVVTLFLAPPLLIESPGPLVFSQMRVGKNGRFFKIYKFRSMYRDAEARKKELESQNEMSGFMFKMKDDPRITKVGKFIRKTSIDELPQFFNVLKGDMSLVGTRPPTVEEFRQYEAHQKRRLSAKPGITGLWQVSGRNAISDFEEVVKLDVQYIDNWSIGLDIKILLKTIGVVFKKEGE
ncbi:MAG: sugar transferase [Roseburia sp.]|jgi:exopolysaccharide biosynthesis polyprenyl glycosylphosphotransferase|nr:sugar transferase [Roseburia sp.]